MRKVRMMTRLKHNINGIDEVLKDLILGIGLYFVVISLLGLIIVEDKAGYILGTVFGSAVALGMAVHMYQSLDKGLDMDPNSAQKYIFSRSMLRLFMMLTAAYIGIWLPWLSFIGVVLGLFGLKFAALMQPLVSAYITKKFFREGE